MKRITKIDEVTKTKHKLKVVAYCRVSSGLEDQLLSLEAQKAHYESYIKSNPEWEYAGIYYDEGITGTKKDSRPQLMKLIADCEHGLVDYVITKSISRFARNTTDCLEMVRKLQELNIPIYFEKENINTLSMESELLLSIMSSIAESESLSISENNRWAYQHRFKTGTYKCCNPPYGYDWDKEKGELVINEYEAEVVKYIFAQILDGVGVSEVTKALSAKNIRTKKGGKWATRTVNDIIKNERYIGDCLLQKTYTDSGYNRHRNVCEKNQYYVEGHHTAIISREDFEAANKLVEQRRAEKNIDANSSKYRNRYPLSSRVVCGECGGSLIRKTYIHKVVLSCRKHIEDKSVCSMKSIDLEKVELAFVTLMNKLIFGKNKVLKPFYRGLKESSMTDTFLQIHNKELELESITEKKLTLKKLFSQGVIEPAIYTQEFNELVAEGEKLQAQKDSITYSASSELEHIEKTKDLLEYVEKAELLTVFDGELFERFVEKIVVKNRTELEFNMMCGLKLTERI